MEFLGRHFMGKSVIHDRLSMGPVCAQVDQLRAGHDSNQILVTFGLSLKDS